MIRKRKRDKKSPKVKDTLTRMWNDYRRSHDVDISKIKTNKELLSKLTSMDEAYGQYASKINNPLSIIKPFERKFLSENKEVYSGGTSRIRKQLSELKIKNKIIIIKKTKTGYSFYSNRGNYKGGVYAGKSRKN